MVRRIAVSIRELPGCDCDLAVPCSFWLRRSCVIAFIVAADASNVSPAEIAALMAHIDPEVRDAIADVDRTLIALALAQSPWDRLRSASRMAQALVRIRDGATPQGH